MADTSPNTQAPADSGMVEVLTRELEGLALDWVVATNEGRRVTHDGINPLVEIDGRLFVLGSCTSRGVQCGYSPSTNMSQGGRYVEQEINNLERRKGYFYVNRFPRQKSWVDENFKTHPGDREAWSYGPTLLIATLRCVMASKLGDKVQVPRSILQKVAPLETAASDSEHTAADESPARERSRG